MTEWLPDRPGVVVLAAFRPDPELFRVQLESIRDQTRGDFTCLIGADGDRSAVERLVDDVVGDDERFRVIGWDDNLGFYLNFERLLLAVPDDVAWVALSDQDDRWHPDKLERLVPLLEGSALATGQARVVEVPGERVVLATTGRRVIGPRDLLVQNQVTGAQTVFRRDLLDVALPFPRLRTVTQLHDHWLAMCAAATEGYTVLDEVVQDYVQHGANIVGEVDDRHPRTPWGAARLVSGLADRYEGGHGPRQLVVAAHTAGLGWRRTMANELARRLPSSPTALDLRSWLGTPGLVGSGRAVVDALRSRAVTTGTALTLAAGLPGELVASRRDRARPSGQAGPDHKEANAMSETVTEAPCWLCAGASEPDEVWGPDGYYRCERCGFLFQPLRGSAEQEAARYTTEYFDNYADREGGSGAYDDAPQRRYEAARRIAYVTRFMTTGSLLEIGSAAGYFVEAARNAGLDAVGVEPSDSLAASARLLGRAVTTGTLADAARTGSHHDAIAMWHVMEHLPEPHLAMTQVRSLLRPEGMLFLELPNIGSVNARRLGRRWPALEPDHHVAHYTVGTISELLRSAGFEIEDLHSMSFREYFARTGRVLDIRHVTYDTLVQRTPRKRHPTRHQLLRVTARART